MGETARRLSEQRHSDNGREEECSALFHSRRNGKESDQILKGTANGGDAESTAGPSANQ
jgi:hypothetical protein